ncbi:MAG: hypothetical protein OJF47_003496 [Nitrospira sp.]|nr:MAG: hypothetical protein OJF47_003496 [Nitrospira sp.]
MHYGSTRARQIAKLSVSRLKDRAALVTTRKNSVIQSFY